MIETDFAFPYNYSVGEVGEFPGTGRFAEPVIYFPPLQGRREHMGAWLKVTTNSGKSWIGVFAFGAGVRRDSVRVASTPQPSVLCVVARGGGYMVDAEAPERWEEIPAHPVLDLRTAPEQGLLIFADFTGLVAYGSAGLVWKSPRLCWDDLKITRVGDETIEGTGYDATNSRNPEMRFIVDVKTGRIVGPRVDLK